VFVSEVFEQSPASEAGIERGDEIVAVDIGSGFVSTADLLASGDTISDVLGPAETGLQRGLRLADASAATREVSLTKRTVTIDPVPDDDGVRILPLAGTSGVGYISLRSYISTADEQLRAAFTEFRAQGIQYFIVDLRYNGGGSDHDLRAARRPAGRRAEHLGRHVANALQHEAPWVERDAHLQPSAPVGRAGADCLPHHRGDGLRERAQHQHDPTLGRSSDRRHRHRSASRSVKVHSILPAATTGCGS
jgi:hypothetical protein